MTMETELVTLLRGIADRVYPDVAPMGAATPYIVWQQLGGEALRYGDGSAPDKRNTYVQVAVWSDTRLEALNLIRQVEETLCVDSTFAAIAPQGEAVSIHEPDTLRYGSIQRFDIWAPR